MEKQHRSRSRPEGASAVLDMKAELGRVMTPSQLGELLGVSSNTIRKYYRDWGGVMLAPGTGIIRFYENVVMEKIYANNRQENKNRPTLERKKTGERSGGNQAVPGRLKEELQGGVGMGNRNGKSTQAGTGSDANRHGLFD